MIGWAIRQAHRLSNWVVRFKAALRPKQPLWSNRRIKVAYTDKKPTKPKALRLYVTSTAKGPTFGYLLCPCGCGETLHLRFLPDRRPRWEINIQADGVVSLIPSVWRRVGCRSHFVLNKGKVDWC